MRWRAEWGLGRSCKLPKQHIRAHMNINYGSLPYEGYSAKGSCLGASGLLVHGPVTAGRFADVGHHQGLLHGFKTRHSLLKP